MYAQCVWRTRWNGRFQCIKSRSYFIHWNSALAMRLSRDFVKDFVEVIDKVLISQRQWEPRQTASGGSSGAWSSLGRTSVVWNHFIQNESHTVYASGGRGWKEHLICTWRGKEIQTTHRKELCFNMSQEWTFRKFTLRLLLRLEALLSRQELRFLMIIFFRSQTFLLRHLFAQIVQESRETVDQFVCRLCQRAVNCEFGESEKDYIRDQVIDKCYSSKLRWNFLEKEEALTFDDLLKIARSQEAVYRQLKQVLTKCVISWVTRWMQLMTSRMKEKKCFSCDQEWHFSGDKRPARDRACRMCGVIGHFKVKCPRVRQRSSGDFGSRVEKVAKKLLVRKEILWVAEVAAEEDVVVKGRKKHFVANKNHSE